ncbi:MAG: hypothetical protein H6R30_515, partial [Methanomicrobia archaeon]|nr:hypothetical protein [Methanomicrobia archaeon]
ESVTTSPATGPAFSARKSYRGDWLI